MHPWMHTAFFMKPRWFIEPHQVVFVWWLQLKSFEREPLSHGRERPVSADQTLGPGVQPPTGEPDASRVQCVFCFL